MDNTRKVTDFISSVVHMDIGRTRLTLLETEEEQKIKKMYKSSGQKHKYILAFS